MGLGVGDITFEYFSPGIQGSSHHLSPATYPALKVERHTTASRGLMLGVLIQRVSPRVSSLNSEDTACASVTAINHINTSNLPR